MAIKKERPARVRQRKEPADTRIRGFQEVNLGLTLDEALGEASRCIQCESAPCTANCPVGVDVPGFINAVLENDLHRSLIVLRNKNSLPGVCARVCPQENYCEAACVLGKKGEPVAIGYLARFVADWGLSNKVQPRPMVMAQPSGRKVAVVGSGPAGLTAAAELTKKGHKITILEALHVAGGVLGYGIPEFRLPKQIVEAEIEYVKSLGVELWLDWVVGRTVTVDELLHQYGFDAIFLGTGAGLPTFLDIPGENLNGIYSANEFLTRVNLMKAYLFPEYDTPINIGRRVAVIGGGNVAMDSARCALRLGAEQVSILYRRSEAEMPARREEIENAKDEGILFRFLTQPKRFLGDSELNVVGVECYSMDLVKRDDDERPHPVIKYGSEHTINVETVVVAVGERPNTMALDGVQGVFLTRHGCISVDPDTGRTSRFGVWAGGDAATGTATVVEAIRAGQIAADSIDEYLRGKRPRD